MRLTLALILSLIAGAAQADVLFGDAAGCHFAAGNPPSTDAPFVLYPDRIERMETTCMIEGIIPEGDGQVRLTGMCSGEGETWANEHILDVSSSDGTYRIWQAEFPDYVSTLRQCGK